MGSCNSTKNGVENEYEYGHDHLVMPGKQMLHNLMVPMVLLLRHQLVWKHHNKDKTAQLLNCSTAQRTQSTDQNDSMANSEEFLRNSYEQIIQKLQSSRDLIWPKV